VKLIVIGYNDTFKDERLSDTYNQWTKSIPIARLRDRLVFLANQFGIETRSSMKLIPQRFPISIKMKWLKVSSQEQELKEDYIKVKMAS
jgi:hypothetical protein